MGGDPTVRRAAPPREGRQLRQKDSPGQPFPIACQAFKIDRLFVSKIRDAAKGVAVVDGMITMAHGLGLRVVCEGVETIEELELLHDLGCDFAQGYHLDQPLPFHALIARWLGHEQPRLASA